MVFKYNVARPTAEFLEPVVLLNKEEDPIAVFLSPVVLVYMEPRPEAVL